MTDSTHDHSIKIHNDYLKNWQDITDILARISGVPAGLIMRVVDREIEVFVSSRTKDNPYRPGDKERLVDSGLYCEHVIKTGQKLHVPNALVDDAWKNNPDIRLNMISYLGFPIHWPDGNCFGTICILDNKENQYSTLFEQLIEKFRDMIQTNLELIYMNHVLGEDKESLSDYIEEIKGLRGTLPICASCKKIRDDKGYWNQVEAYIQQHSDARFSHGLCPDCSDRLYGDKDWYRDMKKKKNR